MYRNLLKIENYQRLRGLLDDSVRMVGMGPITEVVQLIAQGHDDEAIRATPLHKRMRQMALSDEEEDDDSFECEMAETPTRKKLKQG